MCVCVCVCEREREGVGRGGLLGSLSYEKRAVVCVCVCVCVVYAVSTHIPCHLLPRTDKEHVWICCDCTM